MPTDASGREARCYFVRTKQRPDEWVIATWHEDSAGGWWDSHNWTSASDDDALAEIDERRIERPALATPPTVERLRKLLAKATPGPWTNHGTFYGHVVNGPTSGIALDVPERDAILIVAMHEALPALLASPTVSNEIVVGAGTYVEHGTVTGRTEISLPPGTLLVTAAQIAEVTAAWDGVKSSYGWDEEETFDRMNTALRGAGLLLKESS